MRHNRIYKCIQLNEAFSIYNNNRLNKSKYDMICADVYVLFLKV